MKTRNRITKKVISKKKSRKRSLKKRIETSLLDLMKERDPSILPIVEALSKHNPLLEDVQFGHRITTRTALPEVSWQSQGGVIPPIPMIMHCPECHKRHVDQGTFAHKPHHTHACQFCGFVWRPAIVTTVGVQFLQASKTSKSRKAWCRDA